MWFSPWTSPRIIHNFRKFHAIVHGIDITITKHLHQSASAAMEFMESLPKGAKVWLFYFFRVVCLTFWNDITTMSRHQTAFHVLSHLIPTRNPVVGSTTSILQKSSVSLYIKWCSLDWNQVHLTQSPWGSTTWPSLFSRYSVSVQIDVCLAKFLAEAHSDMTYFMHCERNIWEQNASQYSSDAPWENPLLSDDIVTWLREPQRTFSYFSHQLHGRHWAQPEGDLCGKWHRSQEAHFLYL